MEPPTREQPKPRRRFRWWRCLLVATLVAGVSLFGLWAYQRWVLVNFHEVVPGEVYRSAQPSAEHIRKWVEEYDIRTIVNLRSDVTSPVVVEEAALAKEIGLRYESVPLLNHSLPKPAALHSLIETIETVERPMLLHCRAGADRAGLASVVAAMAIGGRDYASARKHLSARYLHLDPFPDHIGGSVKKYEEYCRQQGTGTGGWEQFRHWAFSVYGRDP